MTSRSEITGLLQRWSAGDRDALDALIPIVYERLSEIAHGHLRQERSDHTLDTRALVHETYLKLVDIERMHWRDRAHFRSMASRLMRRILVDYARGRNATKRGAGARKIELNDETLASDANSELVLDLDQALERLAQLSPRQSQVVEQHYFGGLTAEETAIVLGVSRATVERDLRAARAWLAREWGAKS